MKKIQWQKMENFKNVKFDAQASQRDLVIIKGYLTIGGTVIPDSYKGGKWFAFYNNQLIAVAKDWTDEFKAEVSNALTKIQCRKVA